jgi:phosphoglycolate phosphatase
MGKYRAIIWDIDGTLLDTLSDIVESVNVTMRAISLPEHTREKVRDCVGNGITRLIELTVPGGKQHPRFEEIEAFFVDHYGRNSRNLTLPYDGLLPLLQSCADAGVRMGIVSNKGDRIVKELAELYFPGMNGVAIGASAGVRMKPEPDTVFEAMRILGAEKETTVYIGDSEVDVKTAKNAGLDCIAVDWGFRDQEILREAGASIILHTPQELAAYLAME